MSTNWSDQLPDQYRNAVVSPVEYESRSDVPAQSRKVWGFDLRGSRCFYQHEFTLSEDRFDADEFPISVDVFWERVTAWRLKSGEWVRLRKWSDTLDRCPRRYVTDQAVVVGEHQLQL